MDELYEHALKDLKSDFGAKKLLTPDDIAEVIGRSASAQAILRSRCEFPMPIKKVGGKVYISIYDLAKYLTDPTPTKAAKTLSTGSTALGKTSRLPNLAKAILAFDEAIAKQDLRLRFMWDLKAKVEQLIISSEISGGNSEKQGRRL